MLAAVVTIAGKFLIRVNGKHIFNPTNGGIVAMLLLTNQVWVSPGQWGAAGVLRLPDGVRRIAGRQPRGAVRRHLRVHRLLLRARSSAARCISASR